VPCADIDSHGTVGSQVTISGLKYEGGSQPGTWTVGKSVEGQPVWSFTQGQATYQLNIIFTVSVTDPDTKVVTKHDTTCTGTLVYDVTGGVYSDLTVVIPKN
jgi:hypothetical protein